MGLLFRKKEKTVMRKKIITFVFLFFSVVALIAQSKNGLKWWDPAKSEINVIEGQWLQGTGESFYDRLPLEMKDKVRKPVWDLSHNSAGLSIRFRSNADKIIVKYTVKGNYAFPHMPATGVSGVDLYAVNNKGEWAWVAAPGGHRSFGDTIVYRFQTIEPDSNFTSNAIEYKLYLPLYNSVKWLEIGVPEDKNIEPLKAVTEKPVVAYGTSIMQGACASRPGIAWTAQLGRELNMPVINYGFSGNGWLDKEIIEYKSGIDASIYILDCLPNMTAPRFTPEQLAERIRDAVIYLKEKHPRTSILLTEHDGYADGMMRPERFKNYNDANIVLNKVFNELKRDGIYEIYILPKSEINIDINCQTDGIHPNDLGMYRYAQAYSRYIKMILDIH